MSLADMQTRMSQGHVTPAHFVWADGMADWKVMTEVADFNVLVNAPSSSTTQTQGTAVSNATKPFIDSEPSFAPNGAPEAAVESATSPTIVISAANQRASAAQIEPVAASPAKPIQPITAQAPAETMADVMAGVPDKTSTHLKRPRRAPVKTILFLLLAIGLAGAYAGGYLEPVLKMPAVQAMTSAVSDAVRPMIGKLSGKLPFLDKLISPLAPIEDISPEEFEELKLAARGSAESGLPQAAIALSRNDPSAPSVYVSSNLPDGAAIDIYIDGVPDTLLNQMSFSSKLRAVITEKLGKTGVIRYPDGRPIPKGDYILVAIDAEDQSGGVKDLLAKAPLASPQPLSPLPQGRKIVVSRRYFMGGEKDAAYSERLKEFHDKLRAKATEELGLIRQFAGTIESQLSSTMNESDRVRRIKLKPKQTWDKPWADSDKKWRSLNAQLDETFQKWTPESLQNDYIFGSVFQLVRDGATAVAEHHTGYAKAFALKPVEASPIFDELGSQGRALKAFFAELNKSLAELEKSQPATGLPKRDGFSLPTLPASAAPAPAETPADASAKPAEATPAESPPAPATAPASASPGGSM